MSFRPSRTGGGDTGRPPIRALAAGEEAEWRRLRHALWPETTDADHATDLQEYRDAASSHVILVAPRPDGSLAGFAEVRLRSIVDGCSTSPVAFLEGWFVDPDMRRHGVGRALVQAAEDWARSRGCQEFGSDTEADNALSRAAHRSLGFTEAPPTVNFRKRL
jgi:aminoglycoside 6'-N-acetyltransferase I